MRSLESKIKRLPLSPAVYLYKDSTGKIIYVGKAAKLRNRVKQYFQKSRPLDPKTDALVSEIKNLDYIEVETEIDALFLEAELVRRYQPRYNILLRDDKSSVYIRVDINSPHPTVTTTRRPLDDKAEYFGPYFNASLVRNALRQLRRVFPYSTHIGHIPKRACLMYQLGLCPGLEADKISIENYKKNLRQLISYVKGNRKKITKDIEREMKLASKKQDFEKAAQLRNKLMAIKGLANSVLFGSDEFMDISKDAGLSRLADIIGLFKPPKRIEGFDISHMSGTDTSASMVVFVNGLPDKSSYRKFKMRSPGNDDFAHMYEVIYRRLGPKNTKAWGVPDLVLIDGGKGQLSSAIKAQQDRGFKIPMIGLAKREELIVVPNDELVLDQLPKTSRVAKGPVFSSVGLGLNDDVIKLLQRVRDESHRFAVSYHSSLKRTRQTTSLLDSIPGVGPKTKAKLIKKFGSSRGAVEASISELEKYVSPKLARQVKAISRGSGK